MQFIKKTPSFKAAYKWKTVKKLTDGFCSGTIFIMIPVVSANFCWGLLNKFKLLTRHTNLNIKMLNAHSLHIELYGKVHHTHQLIVVWGFIVGAGKGKQEHLRVGMDGDVKLDRVFMRAQKLGHSLSLRFRLGVLTAIRVITWVIWRTLCFIKQQRNSPLFWLYNP